MRVPTKESMPNIGVAAINASTVLKDDVVAATVPALQMYVSEHLALVWVIDATLYFVPHGTLPLSRVRWLSILENSDQTGVLGYHDLPDEGLPLEKVFAGSHMVNCYNGTVAVSHELLKLLIDPDINLTVFVQNATNGGALYSYKICDPCEADQYGYLINGVVVADFVFPSWFQSFRAPRSCQFDAAQQIIEPFELAGGGYINVYDVSAGGQLTATQRSHYAARLHGEGSGGSRRERRRLRRDQWLRSAIRAR